NERTKRMTAVAATQLVNLYEAGVEPARRHFPKNSQIGMLLAPAIDPLVLERFFIHFCSLGVALTEPVEDWLVRSGRRCEEVGFAELGRALRAHSKAESGHHLMMI